MKIAGTDFEMADPAGAAASADILAVVGRTGGRRRMCLAFPGWRGWLCYNF